MGGGCFALLLSTLALGTSALAAGAPVTPTALLVDGNTADLAWASDDASALPRFSWSLTAPAASRGAAQTHAVVTISAFGTPVCSATLANSTQSALCAPAGGYAAFKPATVLSWEVCVTGSDAAGTVACASSTLTIGLRTAAWTAPWLSPPDALPFTLTRPVRARAVIRLPTPPGGTLTRATLFFASPAYYTVSANGAPVSDHEMGSASEFMQRVFVDTWDVTPHVARDNTTLVLGARLASAFYGHAAAFAAKTLSFTAEVHLEFSVHGTPTFIVLSSDIVWTVAPDSITFSAWYQCVFAHRGCVWGRLAHHS